MKKTVLASIVMLTVTSVAIADVNVRACASCHGKYFEKHAWGSSKVVRDMTHTEIAKALKGYKAGTRNKHGLGMIMHAQVAKYYDADLEAFSKTIGK